MTAEPSNAEILAEGPSIPPLYEFDLDRQLGEWLDHNLAAARPAWRAKEGLDEDQVLEVALEAGAEDVGAEGDDFEVTTTLEDFEAVREALDAGAIGFATSHSPTRIPLAFSTSMWGLATISCSLTCPSWISYHNRAK